MNILVIPTTDWIRHPVPNRLNFIFDALSHEHKVTVLHFRLAAFSSNTPRMTSCTLVKTGLIPLKDPSLYYILNAPFHFVTIYRLVRQKNVDVILSANILPSIFANWTGVPVVFDYLDHLEESASVYYPGSWFGNIIQKAVRVLTHINLRHSQKVITVTNELKDFLSGIGITNISVIPNGVDTAVLTPLPSDQAKKMLDLSGRTVIGYVGSLEYWVDLETAVRALPYLDATLLVVGPGLFTDYGESIRTLASELGVADRVVFTGVVEYDRINLYISAMDIGLNPLKPMKKNEYSAGGKVFNYLSCGCPVLSSRIVSLERLLGGDIYYYDDLHSFIGQVGAVLKDKKSGEYYRSLASRYDWILLARQYGKVLESAV